MTGRLLVTNDDGIAAPGLRALAGVAHRLGFTVVVAAPRQEASGASAGLSVVTDDGRVMLERVDLAGLDGVTAFSVAASPAYIVVLAGLGVFGPAPAVVLSGINRGANAGHAVLHSGTVGAALTAANQGAHAMAVSLDVLTGGVGLNAVDATDDAARHWDTAADLAGRLLPLLTATAPATVLNVNVPDLPADRIAGVRTARLAAFGQVQMAIGETGEGFIRTSIETHPEPGAEDPADTDIALLRAGYATVTAITPPAEAPPPDLTHLPS